MANTWREIKMGEVYDKGSKDNKSQRETLRLKKTALSIKKVRNSVLSESRKNKISNTISQLKNKILNGHSE